MMSFAASSESRLVRQASTCRRIGSKLRCMRSTPTERISTRLRCFVCLASTGVKRPLIDKFGQAFEIDEEGQCRSKSIWARQLKCTGRANLNHRRPPGPEPEVETLSYWPV